jgi:16S rRNA processing protein RimM
MSAGWDAMAVVGRIARAHGIRGEVIVNPDTDFPERRFRVGARLFTRRAGEVRPVSVATARMQRGRPVVGFDGVTTMTDAEALAGCELRVPAEDLEPLPDGSYYRHDLVGCVVETVDGRRIGSVTDVEGERGVSRLVVDGASGEVLIPLASEVCSSIDIVARVIVVNLPDGLLELNARPGRRTPGAA